MNLCNTLTASKYSKLFDVNKPPLSLVIFLCYNFHLCPFIFLNYFSKKRKGKETPPGSKGIYVR